MSREVEPLKKLAIFDTIHDFHKERSTKGDNEEEVSFEKMEFIRPAIQETINKYLGTNLDISHILSTLTNGEVRSPSSAFEPNIVTYFEKKFSQDLHTNNTSSETYRSILSDYDNKTLLYDSTRQQSNILIIDPGEESFGQLDKNEVNALANFILTYFHGKDAKDPRFTFDGKSGIIGKIFGDIDQARNIMFPQTIADSAPTSLNLLKGRSDFIFPPNSIATTNIYSAKDYNLSYIDRGFSNRNKFGFSLGIAGKDVSVEVPFSEKETEGPSVNYLIDLMNSLKRQRSLNAVTSKKSTILSLGNYLETIHESLNNTPESSQGLMFDIKRSGDQEQVLAARSILTTLPNTVFSTIDHLCALFARMNKINCIFQFNENIVLYRFNSTVISDPIDQKIFGTYMNAKNAIDLVEKIGIISKSKIVERLRAQLDIFQNLKINGEYPGPASSLPRKIITVLLRERMNDISMKLTSLKISNEVFNLDKDSVTGFSTYMAKLSEFTGNVDSKNREIVLLQIDEIDTIISDVNIKYEAFTRVLNDFNLTEKHVGGLKDIDIEKTIAKSNTFLIKASSVFFNYTCSPFTGLSNNLSTINELLSKLAKGRVIRNFDFYSVLVKMGYFDNITEIVNQYYDQTIVRDIFNIDSKLSINMSLEEKNVAIASLLNNAFSLIGSQYISTGIKRTQKGGAYKQQFDDLSSLFRNVCEISSIYIDSLGDMNDIPKLCEYMSSAEMFPYTRQKLYDILIFWQLGLREIEQEEGYTKASLDTSELVISWFLSFYTSERGISSEVLLDDENIARSRSLRSFNDIYTQVVTFPGIPIESILLIVLHLTHHFFKNSLALNLIDDAKKIKKSIGEGSLNFNTESEWQRIPSFLTNMLIYIKGKLGLRGGKKAKSRRYRRIGKKTRKL